MVALESTLLCHGIPAAAQPGAGGRDRGGGARRRGGAGDHGGDRWPHQGRPDARRNSSSCSAAPEVAKCSTRDLPRIAASGGLGATTVAATAFVAARVGIRIMATGGLGGVHQGGERSLDVSADLEELARTPVTVVCSGVKSILDQARTLERLETLGVPVVGYRCDELPGFYTVETGLRVPRIEQLDELCRLHEAHRALGLFGMVVVQPPPAQHAMARVKVERLVEEARMAARARQDPRPGVHAVHAAAHGGAQPGRHGSGQLRAGGGNAAPGGGAGLAAALAGHERP